MDVKTAEIFEAALTVPILLAVLFGLRNWRSHRMETRDWLSGRDSDWLSRLPLLDITMLIVHCT